MQPLLDEHCVFSSLLLVDQTRPWLVVANPGLQEEQCFSTTAFISLFLSYSKISHSFLSLQSICHHFISIPYWYPFFPSLPPPALLSIFPQRALSFRLTFRKWLLARTLLWWTAIFANPLFPCTSSGLKDWIQEKGSQVRQAINRPLQRGIWNIGFLSRGKLRRESSSKET